MSKEFRWGDTFNVNAGDFVSIDCNDGTYRIECMLTEQIVIPPPVDKWLTLRMNGEDRYFYPDSRFELVQDKHGAWLVMDRFSRSGMAGPFDTLEAAKAAAAVMEEA